MKRLISITFLLFSSLYFSFGQLVKGQIKDKNTNEPIEYVVVFSESNGQIKNSCITDSIGNFEIIIQQNQNLGFSILGYPIHKILEINNKTDTIDLGELAMIYKGFIGHYLVEKKRRFSKKTKTKCIEIDNRVEINPEDLIIKCDDGEISYTWIEKEERQFEINYDQIRKCKN